MFYKLLYLDIFHDVLGFAVIEFGFLLGVGDVAALWMPKNFSTYYNPSRSLISSILLMGRTARSATFFGTSTVGQPNFSAL